MSHILQSITLRAFRCLPRHSRTITSANSANDRSILSEAYDELGISQTPKRAPVAPHSTGPPSSSPSVHPRIDIPPAEDPLLHYLTSSITQHGHRAKAARLVSQTLLHLHAWTRAPPLPILRQAILDASPAVRTLNHKRGGKMVVKPVALGEKQRTRKGVQAVLQEIKKKPGRLPEKLARELVNILRGDSKVLATKNEVHRYAMVNRGNAQTRI